MYALIKFVTMILKVQQEEFPESPRNWCAGTQMGMWHKRYRFPNELFMTPDDYDNWEEMSEALQKEFHIVLPIYIYDHSGLAFSTSPFSCPWDSRQVGFICYKEELSSELTEQMKGTMIDEVDQYHNYVNGYLYEYLIEDSEGEIVISCGGFNSIDAATQEGNLMLKEINQKL